MIDATHRKSWQGVNWKTEKKKKKKKRIGQDNQTLKKKFDF